MADENRMTKQEIIDELTAMANRLETIHSECAFSLTGYADSAVYLASYSVCHAIDLVSIAGLIKKADLNDAEASV